MAETNLNRVNLICPKCGFQVRTVRLIGTLNGPEWFRECHECGYIPELEDAFNEFLYQTDPSDVLGQPLLIGGFAVRNIVSVDIGMIKEISGPGYSSSTRISFVLLYDPSTLSEPSVTGDPEEIEAVWRNILLLDEKVVGNAVIVEEERMTGIMTSALTQVDQDSADIGCYIVYKMKDIDSPPWARLLQEATKNIYRGEGISARPLLLAAYENHLARQLAQTWRVKGKSESEIEILLDDNHYYTWKQRSKYGLEDATGHRLPAQAPNIYNNFHDLHDERSDYLVHIDPDDDLKKVGGYEAVEDFETTIAAMSKTYELCYTKRSRIA